MQEKANAVGTPLREAPPLESFTDSAGTASEVLLGLAGEHQRVNAALAIALASTWEARSPRHDGAGKGSKGCKGRQARLQLLAAQQLPQEYQQGLQNCRWAGRSQACSCSSPGLVPE